jgi:hypothetical protein
MKHCLILTLIVLLFLTSCLKPHVNQAKIQFQSTEFNFGRIVAGDSISQAFNFENTGNDTLFILQVKPTCECTVADYTSTPVLPGNHGYIKVKYTSNKKEDIGKQVKSIVVQTNSDTLLTVLRIVGIVENDSLKKVLSQLKRI